mmetsp:Transcript_13699/g.15241  ORF Transcript_13699/g.15241 Transcript_13699/m.15241 type:complete len:606 (+) Transcript_13699:183-2000(+)
MTSIISVGGKLQEENRPTSQDVDTVVVDNVANIALDEQKQLMKTMQPLSTEDPSLLLPYRTLALIPLLSTALLKNSKKLQPLEAKHFPIVLGRTNLSQWWYQSCNCQQYYCHLHCRPVAQNIGSLSKIMIQIDTKGTAHIVGKNPHLVTILSPVCSNSSGSGSGSGNGNSNGNGNGNDISNSKKKTTDSNLDEKEENKDVPQQIILRLRDILSIGRRDREPWMRFQVVENTAAGASTNTTATATATANNKNNDKNNNYNADVDNKCPKTNSVNGEVGIKQEMDLLTRPLSPTQNERQATIQTQTRQTVGASTNANTNTKPVATQQRNDHRDVQLPEWITTTTTKNTTEKRKKSSSTYYNDYGITDTKQQQHHQDMVETLTKAAAAAGATADTTEREKPKKQYQEGKNSDNNRSSYYNYYHNSNYEADSSAAQRKRRRHTTSSFAPYHNSTSSYNNKTVIRSAEDLFNNGSSRRGGRIHLVVQDYETSARLVQATRRGRSEKLAKATNQDKYNGDGNNELSDSFCQRCARSDRNFIGKSTEVRLNSAAAVAIQGNCDGTGVRVKETQQQQQQSESMGLLSKNYAAALLGVANNMKMDFPPHRNQAL